MLRHAKRLLVVAERATLCAAIVRLVRPLGYCVELASTAKVARQLIAKERFAAVVVAPPGLAGWESTFLCDVHGAAQILVALADGASDANRLAASFPDALICAAQPLDEHKLLAFLGRLDLSQASVGESASVPELLHFAGCTLDVASRLFLNAERQEAVLTHSELALLVAFARNPGRVLSRAQLRYAIDGKSGRVFEAYDRSIDMLVARLRRKIETDAAKPQFIVTVSDAGYKFAPNVRQGEPRLAPPAARPFERRELTVLDCQIVGFAALAAKLDPEDLTEAIGPVYAVCTDAIACFGGTIVHTLGDDLLAVFGYPAVQKNDAAGAVGAALELLRAVRVVDTAPIGAFRARIGVATGLMAVGEAGVSGELILVGEALNRAMDMRAAAAAESVVIAARTRELIGRAFDCRALAPLAVDQTTDALPVWRVEAEIAGMPRFAARRCRRPDSWTDSSRGRSNSPRCATHTSSNQG